MQNKLTLKSLPVNITVSIADTQTDETFGLFLTTTVRETILFIEASKFKSANYTLQPSSDRAPSHELLLITCSNDSKYFLYSYFFT